MNPIYSNGFVYWNQVELLIRRQLIDRLTTTVQYSLESSNRAWLFFQVETPTIIPKTLVSPEHTQDVHQLKGGDIVLRPETTKGTYIVLNEVLNTTKPPVCVWQHGKSFRQEQNAPLSRMKLKEFNQLEFQCAYAEGTKADYMAAVLEPLSSLLDAKIVESDRLPAYSAKTMDLEIEGMEVASISLRKDFIMPVLEIAIGLDRLVYQGMKQ